MHTISNIHNQTLHVKQQREILVEPAIGQNSKVHTTQQLFEIYTNNQLQAKGAFK